MFVVVTGGTGFVGGAITRELISEGWTVRRLARPRLHSAPQTDLAPSGTQCVEDGLGEVRYVDFSAPAALASACRGADAVIHLVGIISELGANTFESVHTGLTANMVNAAREGGVPRFLHMSALGTRQNARSRYHRSKWAAEGLVRDSGLDWTILRPSLIYGPEDSFTRLFSRMSDFSPALPAIGGGLSLMQPVGVKQVAQAFARSLRLPSTVGETYDLCGPERLSLRDILRAILAARHRHRLIVSLPFAVARVQARFLEFLWPRLFHRAPPLNRDQILMLEEDNVGDGSRADSEFGLVHPRFQAALEEQFSGGVPGSGSSGALPTSRRWP